MAAYDGSHNVTDAFSISHVKCHNYWCKPTKAQNAIIIIIFFLIKLYFYPNGWSHVQKRMIMTLYDYNGLFTVVFVYTAKMNQTLSKFGCKSRVTLVINKSVSHVL